MGALADGGVLVWVVADATVDGSETGTSFRQALGFMERGLKLHDTMFFQNTREISFAQNRYANVIEYMFVFSNGTPGVANLIKDKKNIKVGAKVHAMSMGTDRTGKQGIRHPNKVVGEYGVRTNVWRYACGKGHNDPMAHEHPAPFPDALAVDHIITWTNPGDVVLDPMAGSGTTLRAAKDLGRVAVGVEIHADYLPIITGRMAQSVMALAA